ncbi:MAG: Uma2 family endonuclease [Chloroflexota bacterium]|nr:Uma2 family endonuclease [Chloroflexota bacterium]
MSTAIERYQFTVADYERMGEIGILTEDDRVELIAGEIVRMSPIGRRHVQAVNRLGHLLYAVVGSDLTVSTQNPIQIGLRDEPQPDLAVLRGPGKGLVDAAAVLLVIEVADSSREYDRTTKLPCYAAAGIPEAWLVDLVNGVIERYSEPRNRNYRVAMFAHVGESLTSTVLPALTIPADLVLDSAEE